MRRIVAANPLAAIALVLALALSGFFGWRLVDRALYWSDPAHIHQPPAPWMTIGYLARSWHIAPDELAQALDLPPDHPRRRNFAEIAAEQGVPVSDVLNRLSARLAQETARGGATILPPLDEARPQVAPHAPPQVAPPQAASPPAAAPQVASPKAATLQAGPSQVAPPQTAPPAPPPRSPP
ncbi:MAG: hypothetical protein Q4G36_05380 [Paracoccus sp. (in: a-proteobacteria)]|nr:hypothetical protein [Paracoccus sp. (in: a-proteobacteria)]